MGLGGKLGQTTTEHFRPGELMRTLSWDVSIERAINGYVVRSAGEVCVCKTLNEMLDLVKSLFEDKSDV